MLDYASGPQAAVAQAGQIAPGPGWRRVAWVCKTCFDKVRAGVAGTPFFPAVFAYGQTSLTQH